MEMFPRTSYCGMPPAGHLVRVAFSERIDDSVAGHAGNLFRKPRQPLRLPGQPYCLKQERRTAEIPARHLQVGAEHRAEVVHHPVVRSGGRRKQSEIPRQRAGNTLDQPVVRSEIVAPIGDAVGLVDDEEGDALRDLRQHLITKALVAKPLGRNEQDVHFISLKALFHVLPMLSIVGRDSHGVDPHAHRGCNLVPHQRQQWRDQERRPGSGFAQQPGRNEVDEALAPSGLLHYQQPATAFHDVADGVFLPFAELGIWTSCA